MTTELIKIRTDRTGQPAVSGRALHQFLEVETPYTKWFNRMVEYGFVENQDFGLVTQKRATNNPKNPWTEITDHAISLSMAKELCMIQRTDKGKEARQYFIDCERRLKEGKPALTGDELILAAVTELQSRVSKLTQTVATQQEQNEADKPKVLFAGAVATSKDSILVGELAKILKQNGVDIGQNRLFERLRSEGYLHKTGSAYNMPTQRSMDLKLFRIKETAITHSDGHISISKTPKVTGKGQVYFVNKFLGRAVVSLETGGSLAIEPAEGRVAS